MSGSGDISKHQKHPRYLAIEVFKYLTSINPGFMWNFFERNLTPYNLRRSDLLLLPPAKSTRYGVNYLALWGSQTLEEFENRMKNLRSIHCTCNVCRWRIIPFYFVLQLLLVFIMCYMIVNVFTLRTLTYWGQA